MRGWVGIVGAGVALVGLAILRAPGDEAGVAAVGRPAPEIAMTDFRGESFDLSTYRGTPVVVNFWASWCPNCAAEMPDFERVHRAVDGRVAFLGINFSDARGPAEELARATRVTYRLAEDPKGRVLEAFGSLGMPTTVFIDADGRVADIVVGQLSQTQLAGYVERHFGVTVDA